MSYDPRSSAPARGYDVASRAEIDAGLRSYMLRVYNYMALGVAFTGVVSLLVAMDAQIMQAVAMGPMKWVLFIAIIGFGFFAPKVMLTGSTLAGQIAFWAYAGLWGAFLAPIFHFYTDASIARVFFISAGAFAGLSLYGYTTKRDLAPMGKFIMMASIGLLIAIVVNIFVQSTMMHFIYSIVGVLLFAGITAYETQAVKESYFADDSHDVMSKKAVFGAYVLYGAFIGLFIFLLSLFGSRD